MRLLIFRFFALSLFLWVSLCAETLTRIKIGLGTFITISADEKHINAVEEAFGIIEEVELALSSYKPSSPIYILNHEKLARLHPLTYEALNLSKQYYEQTQGYFDITVGSITKDLYRFGEDERVPSEEELKEAHVSFANLSFDAKKASLSAHAKVDLGGMGKGFAVDKATAFLREKKVDDAVISASGDIRCLAICKIEIQNPLAELPLASFETLAPDAAISTSGNYNRYVKSTQNNHLINPKKKVSQDKFISITLISHLPNSDIDAYATAASVMSSEKAYAFLDALPLAYIILQADKKLVVSANIEKYTKNFLF